MVHKLGERRTNMRKNIGIAVFLFLLLAASVAHAGGKFTSICSVMETSVDSLVAWSEPVIVGNKGNLERLFAQSYGPCPLVPCHNDLGCRNAGGSQYCRCACHSHTPGFPAHCCINEKHQH